jgi:hypothetical protein
MKTFLEYISEDKRPLYQRVLPAIKYKDGHVERGLRTDEHEDIRRRVEHKYDPREGEAGFWHPDKKEFVSREDASAISPRREKDSSSFRTSAEKDITKRKKEKRKSFRTVSAGSMSSADRLGSSYALISAHRASKYNSKNEFQFEEQKIDLEEGNPLSRVRTSPRHSILMSAERKGLSPEENKSRMTALKDEWRKRGYGFRKTEGKWDEGGGVGKENSIHVIAKDSNAKAGAELRKHARRLSKQFDQDAFIHRKPDAEGRGTAIYTGTERKGQKDDYGPSRYNVDNPYGETTFKTRKPEAARPKLTFKPRED